MGVMMERICRRCKKPFWQRYASGDEGIVGADPPYCADCEAAIKAARDKVNAVRGELRRVRDEGQEPRSRGALPNVWKR
jgi:hypothetical protein